MGMVSGVDVSNWQGEVDWDKVAGAGIGFAFVKASEGITYRDEFCKENFLGARKAGLIPGLYHFFRAGRSGAEQAESFLAMAQVVGLTTADLPPALDLEDVGGKTPVKNSDLRAEARKWVDLVGAATGMRPLLYVSPNFWADHMRGFDTSNCSLWIAHWGVQTPVTPKGWDDWMFWQHSGYGSVEGIGRTVDLNWFNGTPEELRLFIQKSALTV